MSNSNIKLSSAAAISTDAESFYRDYWVTGHTDTLAGKRNDQRAAFVINTLMGDIATGSRILELGVGGEGGVIAALRNTSEVHGIDVSDSAIAACLAMGIPVTKCNCDKTALPFEDGSFEAIIAFEVFEHFSNPQFVIEEVRRVLKPGGVLVVAVPSPYTYHWPRLFYPDMFTPSCFTDFMLANRFQVKQYDDPFFKNCHNIRPELSSAEKSFSIYWQATKIHEQDLPSLHSAAKQLFSRRDRHGIRIRPIEALELLKQCMNIGPVSLELTTDYLCALLYRVINGDNSEFVTLMGEMLGRVSQERHNAALASSILMIHKEAEQLDKYFLETAVVQNLESIAGTP